MINRSERKTAWLRWIQDPKVGKLIDKLVLSAGRRLNSDLVREIIIAALRVQKDGIDRGDIKILHTTLRELRYAFSVFEPYRYVRKTAIFGSARLHGQDPNYKSARDFAKLITDKGWMVITGAASGIMQAGNEGAGREKSFGVNVKLPFEQKANPHIADDPKLVNFKYFFTRKLIFIKESDATVLYPGGFGTHDEGFETLTLVQTGKSNPRPIVCVDAKGSDYWKDFRRFLVKHMAKTGMIDPDDMNMIHFTQDPHEAVKIITDFYANYHSLRFIRDRLVMRLLSPLSTEQLKDVNRLFKGLLVKGKIVQQLEPFQEEEEDLQTRPLPRISFYFNRHKIGKLYQLIDFVNQP